MKKMWVAPKLIILVRGKPAEAVLQICKHPGGGIALAPNIENVYCQSYAPPICVTCELDIPT